MEPNGWFEFANGQSPRLWHKPSCVLVRLDLNSLAILDAVHFQKIISATMWRTYFDIMAHRSCNFLTEWGMDCRFVLYKSFLKLTTCESLKCFLQLFHDCSRLGAPWWCECAPFFIKMARHLYCFRGDGAFAGLGNLRC